MTTKLATPCQHIMDSGRNCASPRLKRGRYCYWHNRLHLEHHFPGSPSYQPPILDSANAVALAVNHLYRGQTLGVVDAKTARHLQTSLRLALQAFRLLDHPAPDQVVTEIPDGIPTHADTSPAPTQPSDKLSPASVPALSNAAFTKLADSVSAPLTPEQDRTISRLLRRSAG